MYLYTQSVNNYQIVNLQAFCLLSSGFVLPLSPVNPNQIVECSHATTDINFCLSNTY